MQVLVNFGHEKHELHGGGVAMFKEPLIPPMEVTVDGHCFK